MKSAKYVILTIFLLIPPATAAIEPPDLTMHLEIRQMDEAKEPYFVGNNCIITYKANHPIRYVGAAFEHEQFSTIHPFIKNDSDTFILIFPIETNSTIEELQYRLVVDGLWMADPNNPNARYDNNGIKISIIDVPDRLSIITSAPIQEPDGKVRFIYRGPRERNIYLVGDFNNWDPFMHKMHEVRPGFYQCRLQLLPGRHYYYFVSNGLKMLDPLNADQGLDYEGEEVSYFSVSPPESGK
jgi:hypothetical protein